MVDRRDWIAIVACLSVGTACAQQVPDLGYTPTVERPAYAEGTGPRIVLDAAHHNFHTVDGRYRTFAALLRRGGYRVEGGDEPFSAETLKGIDVLVIANPVHERNVDDWSLPTPSAFTADEIAAVHDWVEAGGALFLIADHMPFPGAAGSLAEAFGVRFSNGYARPTQRPPGRPDTFEPTTGLRPGVITQGRPGDPPVTKVATFGGSAFQCPPGATPILVFGEGSISRETTKAPGITPDAPTVPIAGWAQGAIATVGKGRLAVFGEAAMFSAQLAGPERTPMGMNHPDAAQNHQLLRNVLHWLTRADAMPD